MNFARRRIVLSLYSDTDKCHVGKFSWLPVPEFLILSTSIPVSDEIVANMTFTSQLFCLLNHLFVITYYTCNNLF